MDGWGSLTVLIKRQNANKYKKAERRYELQKKEENFIEDHKGKHSTLEFPTVSPHKLAEIKQDIRKKAQKEFLWKMIINIIASIVVTGLILLWIKRVELF